MTKTKILDCIRIEFDRETIALENKESIEVKRMINGTKSEAEKEIKKIE